MRPTWLTFHQMLLCSVAIYRSRHLMKRRKATCFSNVVQVPNALVLGFCHGMGGLGFCEACAVRLFKDNRSQLWFIKGNGVGVVGRSSWGGPITGGLPELLQSILGKRTVQHSLNPRTPRRYTHLAGLTFPEFGKSKRHYGTFKTE